MMFRHTIAPIALTALALVTVLAAAAIGWPVTAAAQIEVRIDQDRWGRPVFRIGQDYNLRPGAAVDDVVVVFGDATIEGRVDRDVVVVLGSAQLKSTAVIDGSLVVVGGHVQAHRLFGAHVDARGAGGDLA